MFHLILEEADAIIRALLMFSKIQRCPQLSLLPSDRDLSHKTRFALVLM